MRGSDLSCFFQQMRWPSGKGLGGSSSINYLVYQRGSRHNYDSWAEMGCEGWSYNDVLPYFIKAEKNKNTNLMFSGKFLLLTF